MEKKKNVPVLRFPEFSGEWEVKKFGTLTNRVSNSVEVNKNELYNQIGIRSHGKGIFYKDSVSGKSLGNKRVFWVKENTFIVNIVFAWEQAVAKTTLNEIGMIASHRFPMYASIDHLSSIDYLLHFFLTKKGKSLLELASPGGAGRNKTLGQKELENLKFPIPIVNEQIVVARFLTTVNCKIQALKKKKSLLEQYRKGVMQKIFSKELRFKDYNGKEFSKWDKAKLGEIADIRTGKRDMVNKVENGKYPFFVRSANIEKINTYSFDGEAILIPGDGKIGEIFHYINGKFDFHQRVYKISSTKNLNMKYLYYYLFVFFYKHAMSFTVKATVDSLRLPIVQSFEIHLPCVAEQTKIANFLSAIDDKINICNVQIEKTEQWKKGLLQKMFV